MTRGVGAAIGGRYFAEVIAQDEPVAMDAETLDDALWLTLVERIEVPADLDRFSPQAGVYFASRLVEWDLMNGGVVQVAMNNYEWFPSALAGFEALGHPESLAYFRDVASGADKYAHLIQAAAESDDLIDEYLDLAEDHEAEALDERLARDADAIPAGAARIAFVRANRDAFRIG